MATFLRDLSYRYQWLYDSISRLAALSVGGEQRFRGLALEGLTLTPKMKILDLCCGSAQATQVLVAKAIASQPDAPCQVTGLDASPLSLRRAKHNVPQASYIEAFAEKMPLADHEFDLVHTSTALHEMEPEQLRQIVAEVFRVLKPGGRFVLIDLHRPTNPLFWPGLAVFMGLFETETAWELIRTDLRSLLASFGFEITLEQLYAGGSLQVIQAQKPG